MELITYCILNSPTSSLILSSSHTFSPPNSHSTTHCFVTSKKTPTGISWEPTGHLGQETGKLTADHLFYSFSNSNLPLLSLAPQQNSCCTFPSSLAHISSRSHTSPPITPHPPIHWFIPAPNQAGLPWVPPAPKLTEAGRIMVDLPLFLDFSKFNPLASSPAL